MPQSIPNYWTHLEFKNKGIETLVIFVILVFFWCISPFVYEYISSWFGLESFKVFTQRIINSNAAVESVEFFSLFGLIAVLLMVLLGGLAKFILNTGYARSIHFITTGTDQIICFALNWACVMLAAKLYSDSTYGGAPWMSVFFNLLACLLTRWLFVTLGSGLESYVRSGRERRAIAS